MTEPQTEQQRREELSSPYHPDSAEGRALRRHREGVSEEDGVTDIEIGEEIDLDAIDRRLAEIQQRRAAQTKE
jgi:hypothetical protein